MTARSEHATQLRRGVVEACILGLLAREPMYGWQLADKLISGGEIIASIGTLYPVLTRLRERGEVSSFHAPSESGPPRRYYELTAAGRQSLQAFRDDWGAFTASVTDFITPEETP